MERMKASLVAHGQLTPLVVVEHEGKLEIVDGFKRRSAAMALEWPSVTVSVREMDETGQWVTMLALNRGVQSMTALEEALVLREMLRQGVTQVEIGSLVGRHKSWVSRRIGLVERLHPELVEWVKTGTLAPGTARRLLVLPAGNQVEFAAAISRARLRTEETELLVSLWQKTDDATVRQYLLREPRQALANAQPGEELPADPRLSPRGQRLQRSLRILAGVAPRTTATLRSSPPASDLEILRPELKALHPVLARLHREVGSAAKRRDSGWSAARIETEQSCACSEKEEASEKPPALSAWTERPCGDCFEVAESRNEAPAS
jgi:ParB/RepB/Spo0J family partition protein